MAALIRDVFHIFWSDRDSDPGYAGPGGIRREFQVSGNSRQSTINEDRWRQVMNESEGGIMRGLGWILFIAGVLGISGIAIYEFIIDTSMATPVKILAGLVWIGLGVLLVSVLRQRLIERKTDKYKDVEI
jgi:hypothetical protein